MSRAEAPATHEIVAAVCASAAPRGPYHKPHSIVEQFEVKATDMLAALRQQGLEGVIAKRKDSLYEAGKRAGSWVKYRGNCGKS